VSERRYEKMQQICLSFPHHLIPRPQLPPILFQLISAHHHLCLALLTLQVLVCAKCTSSTNEDDCVKTDAQSCGVVCGCGSRGGGCDLGFWVSFLKLRDQKLLTVGRQMRDSLTWRFNVPTASPSRISRASSLCPTSSKASVASCPPTSSRTSSPPLDAN
jgi:hypothetical protein